MAILSTRGYGNEDILRNAGRCNSRVLSPSRSICAEAIVRCRVGKAKQPGRPATTYWYRRQSFHRRERAGGTADSAGVRIWREPTAERPGDRRTVLDKHGPVRC